MLQFVLDDGSGWLSAGLWKEEAVSQFCITAVTVAEPNESLTQQLSLAIVSDCETETIQIFLQCNKHCTLD